MKRVWGAIKVLIPLLPVGASRFLKAYIFFSCSLALLDILALGLLAVIMTPLMQGSAMRLPVIGEVPESAFVWVLLAICLLMVVKSALNILLQWIATRRFSGYELEIGDKLFDAYVGAPWTERLGRNTAELVRLSDVGIANVISGVLLPAIALPTQVVTFLSVLFVLVIAQPVTAAITLVYLAIIAAILYWGISRRALVAGRVNQRYSFRVATLITEMVGALKEITLRQKLREVGQVVHVNRERSTRARANIQFLSVVPKYVIESALVGGFLLVGAVGYFTGGRDQALAAIAFFAVAGFRMVPSITGFQAAMTQTSAAMPHVEAVERDIRSVERYRSQSEEMGKDKLPTHPQKLILSDVSFSYPNSDREAVAHVDLEIPIGSSVGLAGTSGAGKSTLVDLFLGLILPSSGAIQIDDQSLADVLGDWRSRVGYVPQDVALFDGTIAQNVALTWGMDYDEEQVIAALQRAQLWDTVQARPGGLNARIGERGLSLSGGQRQRLGIARALYTNPLVLVMDEATSALDTTTEEAVAQAIRELHGAVTVISVAHRLSTIRDNDQICFMRDGGVVARGNFDEVVAAEPEFKLQAQLAGLV